MSNDFYLDLSPELSQRLYDIVNAIAHGHDGLFLMAEAAHVVAEIDKLSSGSVELPYDTDPEED